MKRDVQKELSSLRRELDCLKKKEKSYKKNGLELRESEERFRKLFDATMEAIVLHEKGRILAVNKFFLKMFGYRKKSEIIGKSVLDLATPKYRNIVKRHVLSGYQKVYIAEGKKCDGTIVKAVLSSRPVKLRGRNVRVTVLRDITSQDKEQKELKLFKTVADVSKYGSAIMDMNKRLVYINGAFAKMHGYSKKELIGRKILLLHSNRNLKKIDKSIEDVIKKGGFIDCEQVHLRKDGTEFVASMSAALIEGDSTDSSYMTAVIIDISDRKKAEVLLKAERAQLLSIFDSIDEVIYVTDPHNYEILYMNKFFKKILGKNSIGGFCYREFQNFDRPCYFCTNEIILKRAGRPYKWEYHNPILDKDYYIVDRIIKWPDGRDVRFEIAIDITERKKAEALIMRYNRELEGEVKRRTDELLKAERKLEESKRLSDIGMLAATVAHELNNPLGVIKTAVFNIRKERAEIDDDLEGHLFNIEKKISQSSRIIKNLLGYAKIKKPIYEKVDIITIVDECIDSCSKKYSDYEVVIDKRYKIDRDKVIKADIIQIIELFTNILENAFQSFKGKKGKIIIIVNRSKDKSSIDFKIRDSGSGVPEDDLDNVFEPFFTKKPRGLGLGLTVSKQIVHLHRGSIYFKSKLGEGTEVNISLPCTIG
ncbi:MAG: PAS domain S-box protein [Candidatus Kaelpia imicola]|nr:PAS domain S-box protein [Candidatus Kaelpia imicola]